MGNFVNLNEKNENMLRNIVSIISLEEEEKKLSNMIYDKFKKLLLANHEFIENDDEPCLIDRYHVENENEVLQFKFCSTYITGNGVIMVYDYRTDQSFNLSSLRIKDQITLYHYFYNAVNEDL